MTKEKLILITVVVLLFLALLGFLRLLRKPIQWAFKLLLNAGLGFVLLFILNFAGSWVGISLPITWPSVLVSGILGIPGVIILLIFEYII